MSTSVLERTRQNQEDIELFQRSVVFLLGDEPKNVCSSQQVDSANCVQHRENVLQSHWMNFFGDKVIDRCSQLTSVYKDEDGYVLGRIFWLTFKEHSLSLHRSRKEEIQAMGGKGEDLFNNFYAQLRQIKQYHNKFANLQPERPEAEQLLNNTDFLEHIVRFTGEEGFGRYLDLHAHFEKFINLKGINNDIDYMKYISIFFSFPDKDVGMYFSLLRATSSSSPVPLFSYYHLSRGTSFIFLSSQQRLPGLFDVPFQLFDGLF
jgi:splicing factor 3A subunit 3